jgi:hypothetical protein
MSNRIARIENRSDKACAQSTLNTDDNVYYNVIINNTTATSIPATYSEQKVQSILEHPEQYYLSLVRFSLCGNFFPIFYFKDGAYYVTLTYLGNPYQVVVPYIPHNINTPEFPNSVFSYEAFIDMINAALVTAFTAMKAVAVPAGVTDPPFFTYNAATELFTLHCQVEYAGNIDIWFNYSLYSFFENFNVFWYGENNANHQDVRFNIMNRVTNREYIDYTGTVPSDSSNGKPYYYFTQEYPALFNFASLKTITFKTATIPVRSEYTPTNTATSGDVTFNPIMVDFEINPEDSPALYRGYLSYTPTAQYRLVDLIGRAPLNNFQISVTYKDNNLNEFPVLIPPGQSLSLKLAFVKKDLYKKTVNIV